jgi:rhodanese-related sulfurtransferase
MTAETLIDVREYPEFAAGHISGSKLVPLGQLQEKSAQWDRSKPLTLVCKSGRRAEQARIQLASSGFTALHVLDGGIDAWRSAGKPLSAIQGRPWSLERQVRAAAGTLILITMTLGRFFSPYFFLGTAFIGAGLLFAGISDTCMMGLLLAKLPWNRPTKQ